MCRYVATHTHTHIGGTVTAGRDHSFQFSSSILPAVELVAGEPLADCQHLPLIHIWFQAGQDQAFLPLET